MYVLLPLSVVIAQFYVWQGMPQNIGPYVDATTLEGAKQTIAQGPVASQEAIKILGTNGGGFLNANSAHPYENPNALTNLLLSIFAIGAALTNVLGERIASGREHGRQGSPVRSGTLGFVRDRHDGYFVRLRQFHA
jgi:K+-transporting ATPase ATPase A chain